MHSNGQWRTQALREHAPLTVLAVHRVAASAWTGNPIIYPEDRPEAQRVLRAAKEAVTKAISKLGDAPAQLGDGARVYRPVGARTHRGLA